MADMLRILLINRQDMIDSFFQNAVCGKHKVSVGDRSSTYILDGTLRFRLLSEVPRRKSTDVIYVCSDRLQGEGQEIPLWMFGLLY